MTFRRLIRKSKVRIGRLLSGEDLFMKRHMHRPRYHYSEGMEPGSFDEDQQVEGGVRNLRREAAKRKVASAHLRTPTPLRRIA